MANERDRRRTTFQEGMRLPLADRQAWTFPAPEDTPALLDDALRREYSDLLMAHCEAEDQAEKRIAELSLAIFLIGLNYELDARELQSLFTFTPGSDAASEAMETFQLLAADHVRYASNGPGGDPGRG
ncbi:MAG: hypothetical protein U0790_27960 [Isosphaeraceae bacterium]